jgi:DNA-binding response OmpR family regulator
MKVLFVEDEEQLAKGAIQYLRDMKMIVDWAATFSDASEKISINTYDYILLDLGLPDGDGMDLFPEIKEYQQDALVIILTARDEVNDKVRAFEKGADDYLPKPFSLLELKARMQAILRRKSGWNNDLISIGDFTLDINSASVSHKGTSIPLTKKEFNLLHFLIIHKNRVINRYQLAEHLWGDHIEDEYQSNFINVHIKNLRKKLGEVDNIDWLETVRGVGYRINV